MASNATSTDILRLSREMYEMFNRNELERIITHVADDAEFVDTPWGQTYTGRADILNLFRTLHTSFPDIHVEIKEQILCGTIVVNEIFCRGTHKGPLPTPQGEIAATNRRVEFPLCEIWQFRGRKVASFHIYHDNLTLMRQLGQMGETAEQPARIPSERRS